MSASNKKSWILVAVGGAAALAAVLYGIRWISHQQTRKVVTQQVEEWEKLWLPARACLVGDESAFESAGHAYLMYEATHTDEPGRERACEPLIRKIKRPGSESTGVSRVEASWDNIREATKELSRGFVGVIDQSTYSPMGPRRARLMAALDGMDAAHARLRSDGEMDAFSARSDKSAPDPLPEGFWPAALGDMTAMTIDEMNATNGVVVLSGRTSDRIVRAVVRGPKPDDVEVQHVAPEHGMMLAADRSPWGMWIEYADDARNVLRVADLDASGARVGEGEAIYDLDSSGHHIFAEFALGAGDNRAVVFQIDHHIDDDEDPLAGLYLARSTDGGVTWNAPVMLGKEGHVVHRDRARARLDMVLFTDDGAIRWLPIEAASLSTMAQPRRLFPGSRFDNLEGCMADGGTWWRHQQTDLYHADREGGIRPVVFESADARTVTCRASALLLESDTNTGKVLHRCDMRACEEVLDLPLATSSRHVVALDGESRVVAVTQTNDLVLVWRGQELAGAYASEPGYEVRDTVEWDGALHLIMVSEEGDDFRFVPLP